MEMNTRFFRDTFGWGFLLWVFGYILGIILFMLMPASIIGWVITPIATIVTLWVLMKKIESSSLLYYFLISIIWTAIAVIFDYFLIVKAFKPKDGYYKPDVYLYYALTFILPIVVGWYKQQKVSQAQTTR